jgi:alkaline phosphatase
MLTFLDSNSQPGSYSTANAHSHNDYEQPLAFETALRAGFGSIEADIFLVDGKLIVAHDKEQLKRMLTLDSLYLLPLQKYIRANRGYVYKDTGRALQLMIDIKSEPIPTLSRLVEKLKTFPVLVNAGSLHIVISGNRPPPSEFKNWPSWIMFDGELNKDYSKEQLNKIAMLSDNFARYSKWNGEGEMAQPDLDAIKSLISKVHSLHKKIRFWNAPDNLNAWKTFIALGVDYLNTDHIEAISDFLNKR